MIMSAPSTVGSSLTGDALATFGATPSMAETNGSMNLHSHVYCCRTHAVEVTLPGPDNSTTHVVVTIPMLSVKAGTMVYAKLPLELDQAFIKAAKVKNSTVQDNCVENWRNHIEKTYQDDSSFRYVVMKFPDNASDLIDALFRVKVASEMAVGRLVSAGQGCV